MERNGRRIRHSYLESPTVKGREPATEKTEVFPDSYYWYVICIVDYVWLVESFPGFFAVSNQKVQCHQLYICTPFVLWENFFVSTVIKMYQQPITCIISSDIESTLDRMYAHENRSIERKQRG